MNTERQKESKRVLVVGIEDRLNHQIARESLDELRLLAETLGYEVVGEVVQRRDVIHPAFFLGRGKIDEIKEIVEQKDIQLVLFDAELNPRQIRNVEKMVDAELQDRSEVILNIFAKRAKTSQAKLQVELARMEYTLPRLRNMWTHFSRTEGRVGMRAGSGEKQLEEDLRTTRRRIHDLKRSLTEIEKRKQREVDHRSELLTVSLVGYTNVGKSTLMNRLTSAKTFVEDKLFATLDTKTRVWELPGNRRVLLSDTVGFLRNLPHNLIASFHATLEETTRADLLLHVVDASHPNCQMQIQAVKGVLEEIGATGMPTFIVLNKVDRVESELDLRVLMNEYPDNAAVSARDGTGFEKLIAMVTRWIDDQREEFEVKVPVGEGRLLSRLAQSGTIVERATENGVYRVLVRMNWADAGRLLKEFGNGVDFHRVTT